LTANHGSKISRNIVKIECKMGILQRQQTNCEQQTDTWMDEYIHINLLYNPVIYTCRSSCTMARWPCSIAICMTDGEDFSSDTDFKSSSITTVLPVRAVL